jgi:hypothetical protein
MKKRSFLENAIFKIDSALLFDEKQIQNIIKESNSEIVTVSRDFCDFKVWKRSDINDLYNKLKPFGIMQFVRSGRISVSKKNANITIIRRTKINKKIRQWQNFNSLPLRLQLEQLGVCNSWTNQNLLMV